MGEYAYTPWIWPLLASAAFQAGLSLHLWRRREIAGARPLALAMFTSALWLVTELGELSATQLATQEAWFLARDALVVPALTVTLWFALEYAGLDRWLTRPVVAILAGALILLAPLYLIDGGHVLWARLWWDGGVRGDVGPVGLAFTAYGYLIAVVSTGLLLLLFVRSPAHRVPVALIVIGQIATRVVYPLAVFNVANVPSATSMAVTVDFASLMYVVALFRFRLFDLVPVARQTIVERMPDSMLVLDTHDRIADLNLTAARLLDVDRREVTGRPVLSALAAMPDLARAIVGSPEGSAEARFDNSTGSHRCEVRSAVLSDWQGRPIGRLVVLHDITALRHVEAQLVERERALAAAEERERLARELHDGIAQELWLAKLKATRLAAQPDLGTEARALTDDVTAAVDAGIAEVRDAVDAMRLTGEGRGSFRQLLTRALDTFEDRFGLGVELDCDDELPQLPPRAEAETLRIVHEALTNVRRHADATVVRVRASVDDGRVSLEIRDNGCGFDPETVGDAKYGLAGMRERAALIGGEIRIESAPRRGTRVRLLVPVAESPLVAAGRP